MKKRTDFLVLGSGIAGLSFALKASKFGKVSIVTKANLEDTNTRFAQGGIAAVFSEPDNFEKHIHDTLIAGAGCCNEEVVRMVVSEAPARIKDLIGLGVPFDKKKMELLIFTGKAGILSTGFFIIRTRRAKP